MSWSPQGDRLAYFVRTEKDRSLHPAERHLAQGRSAHPDDDGRFAGVAGHLARRQAGRVRGVRSGIINDIFTVNLDTKEIVNLTKDEFADYAPTWAPDGKSIVYLKRVSGNEKLFRLDLATGKSTQLTFGTHDEGGAQFLDADTLVFTSTATDPAKPIDPEVAKNGAIHNVWTLNLKNGELQQYTDALAGNFSPVVLHGRPRRAAHRVRHATTRANTACTRSTARSRWPRPRRPTSARPARSSTSRRR